MYSILDRIRTVINEIGISDSQFAKKCDIPQATFSNMFQRKSEPRSDLLQQIVKNFNVNPSWLLTGEGEMFLSGTREVAGQPSPLTHIPLLSQKVSCGPGKTWESEQNIVEYMDVSSISPCLKGHHVFGFRTSGTSMLGAGIQNGDIVLFSADSDQALSDGIYVFSLDGDAYCKRLEFDPIANRIKIYSVRVADLEKAELLTTLTSTDPGYAERFCLFGRVYAFIHTVNG